MAGNSAGAVYAAIAGNSIVAVAKLIAFGLTGSGAMLSEGIHSIADVGNQSLLALGMRRAKRAPDEDHPYGYEAEAFIWALISAVGIFFLGCGVTVMHGIHSIMSPHAVESIGTAYIVLAIALVVEGYTTLVAYRAVSASAKAAKMSLMTYIRTGPDPMGVAVLIEDSAAVTGVLLAAACLGMGQYTGDPRWDGVGSILIGVLLGFLALFLIQRNKALLLGRAVNPARRKALVKALEADPIVSSVELFRATIAGAESARLSADVDFDGAEVMRRYLEDEDLAQAWDGINSEIELQQWLVGNADPFLDFLGTEVDRVEARIREADPGIADIDLESD